MSGVDKQKGLSSFSVILVMTVLMIVGAAMLPMLDLHYSPDNHYQSLTVSFSYQGASARIIESEVTSVVEGALNTLEGVVSTNAVSSQNGGYVSIEFKKGVNMEMARFEAAARLRQIASRLPAGVHPYLGGSVSGGSEGNTQILRYTVNADMTADRILDNVQKHIIIPLSRIDGVESVESSGAAPFQWIITFDPNSLRAVGLTPGDLQNAFAQQRQNSIIGTQVTEDRLMLVRLRSTSFESDIEEIPIKSVDGRLYYIGDFAKVTYEEQPPSSYNRINGLNTIDIAVYGSKGINTIKVAKEVKDKMAELKESFPAKFSIRQTYDASVQLKKEIRRIFFRAIMSLFFLLMFVLLVSRSFRYLAIIGLTITANLLSAVIFYWLFDIGIELYSMAGITVSLGIIIDTAIVMVDHFTYYGNRRVMTSIMGALMTTIAALLIVFFLPESMRQNLTNFVWVIVINLTLSMLVAFLFVPALLDKIPLQSKGVAKYSVAGKRRIVGWSHWYERFILWSRGHRWIFVVLMLLMFGIPIHLLPSQVHHKDNGTNKGGLVGVYNATIGSKWYQKNRAVFEYILGGSFNYFSKSGSNRYSYREPEPSKTLNVYANMAEGCTAQQMNEIIVGMENWLSQFDGIEMYETSVNGASASIRITFEREAGRTRFPYELKQKMWAKAMNYGGATWTITSLGSDDNTLTNNTYRTYWDHTIDIYGYNYDLLYRYAEDLRDTLLTLKRVPAAEISYRGSKPGSEFFLDLDREKIAMNGLDVRSYVGYMNNQLYQGSAGQIFDGEDNITVMMKSAELDYFDLWHISNDMIRTDSTQTRLSDLGSITKRQTGVQIIRQNQEYVISVGYDFIGSWDLSRQMEEKQFKRLNASLPIGFHAGNDDYYRWSQEKNRQALLIFIIAIIIYMICSILFESLNKPFSIILMIPLGFVGLFIAYPLFGVMFDQGGFAAMVMLCGIVVNASIYMISEYDTVTSARRFPDSDNLTIERRNIRYWIKAYNRKIIPTLLTIISTVLGLIPFLFDGKDDAFWYAFAIGVIGGMIFSIIALVFFMPVFVPLRKQNRQH